MKIAFADIETDSLDPKEIVLVCFTTVDTDDPKYEVNQVLTDTSAVLRNCSKVMDYDFVVFHNGVGFDVPALKNVGQWNFDNVQILDTLLLSRMLCPDRKAHSLESWGKTFGLLPGS